MPTLTLRIAATVDCPYIVWGYTVKYTSLTHPQIVRFISKMCTFRSQPTAIMIKYVRTTILITTFYI